MANPEHVAMLREGGIHEWNAWRLAHPAIIPDLFKAELSKADLAGDDASGANLEDANLLGTNLHGVNLREASLGGARLGFTIFGNTNLTRALGLDICQHVGPSVVDYQTLAKSWPLSLVFLRDCGLPETLIEYLPSLLSKPIQFYSCFISYSTRDQDSRTAFTPTSKTRGFVVGSLPRISRYGIAFDNALMRRFGFTTSCF
jgi:Pentapeptide repeats (8 copies)